MVTLEQFLAETGSAPCTSCGQPTPPVGARQVLARHLADLVGAALARAEDAQLAVPGLGSRPPDDLVEAFDSLGPWLDALEHWRACAAGLCSPGPLSRSACSVRQTHQEG